MRGAATPSLLPLLSDKHRKAVSMLEKLQNTYSKVSSSVEDRELMDQFLRRSAEPTDDDDVDPAFDNVRRFLQLNRYPYWQPNKYNKSRWLLREVAEHVVRGSAGMSDADITLVHDIQLHFHDVLHGLKNDHPDLEKLRRWLQSGLSLSGDDEKKQ